MNKAPERIFVRGAEYITDEYKTMAVSGRPCYKDTEYLRADALLTLDDLLLVKEMTEACLHIINLSMTEMLGLESIKATRLDGLLNMVCEKIAILNGSVTNYMKLQMMYDVYYEPHGWEIAECGIDTETKQNYLKLKKKNINGEE